MAHIVTVSRETMDARVKTLLRARNWSYSDLAQAADLPKQTVLRGPKLPGVTAHTVARIAVALDTTLDYLYLGRREP